VTFKFRGGDPTQRVREHCAIRMSARDPGWYSDHTDATRHTSFGHFAIIPFPPTLGGLALESSGVAKQIRLDEGSCVEVLRDPSVPIAIRLASLGRRRTVAQTTQRPP
jgi:hypothetical protein